MTSLVVGILVGRKLQLKYLNLAYIS